MITKKTLQHTIDRLNVTTGAPVDGPYNTPRQYQLEHANGGYSVVITPTDSGGVHTVIARDRARTVYLQLRALLLGLITERHAQTDQTPRTPVEVKIRREAMAATPYVMTEQDL